jgi:hypothetical protein
LPRPFEPPDGQGDEQGQNDDQPPAEAHSRRENARRLPGHPVALVDLLEPEVAPFDEQPIHQPQTEDVHDRERRPIAREQERGGDEQRGVEAFVLAKVDRRPEESIASRP